MEPREGFCPFPVQFETRVRRYDLGETQIPAGTALLAFRGSVAHGMFVDPNDVNGIDDVDLIGMVIPDQRYYIGLSEWGRRGTKEFREGIWDGVYYDAHKLVSMLQQGNPNVLSLLWTKPAHRLLVTEVGQMLLDNRRLFVGKHVFNAFAGYANAQLLKMESRDPAELREYVAITNELKYRGAHPNHKGECFPRPGPQPGEPGYIPDAMTRNRNRMGEEKNAFDTSTDILLAKLRSYQRKGENIGYMGDKRKQLVIDHGYDSKNAAHCIRLLRMCIEFLNIGGMSVYRPDAGDDQELLSIKRGDWTLEAIKKHVQELFEQARAARDASTLPDQPDRDAIECLVIRMIQDAWLKDQSANYELAGTR